MSGEKDCPFCPMFGGGTGDVIDIEPLNPVVKGHRIVIPRQHVEDFTVDQEVSALVMKYAVCLAQKMGDVNLIINKGKYATQTVKHLHVHLVPRRENDKLLLPWTNQKKM